MQHITGIESAVNHKSKHTMSGMMNLFVFKVEDKDFVVPLLSKRVLVTKN
jgi:hypothetical protein